MADRATDLANEIGMMRAEGLALPSERVVEKMQLNEKIDKLEEELAKLRSQEARPVADSAITAEAKDDIGVVQDIVGAKATPPPPPPVPKRDILPEEAVDFVMESHAEVSDPRQEAEHERGAAAREAERRRRDVEDADRTAAHAAAAEEALLHPAGEELAQETPAAVAAGPAAALGKDVSTKKMVDESQKQGCATSPKVLTAIGIGGAVVIAIILVILKANGGESTKASTAGASNPAGAAASNGEPGSDSGDVAKFAGHYVLVTGFEDINGPLIFATAPGRYAEETLAPAIGDIDVDDHGAITGGRLTIKKHSASSELTCDFTFTASSVTGTVAMYGDVGLIGQVTWKGPLTTSTCSDSSYETGVVLPIGIAGGDLSVCGAAMGPTLVACTGPGPSTPYALFRKET